MLRPLVIEINLECDSCGNALTGTYGKDSISVEPCQYCMNNLREEAYDEGYKAGQETAYAAIEAEKEK